MKLISFVSAFHIFPTFFKKEGLENFNHKLSSILAKNLSVIILIVETNTKKSRKLSNSQLN